MTIRTVDPGAGINWLQGGWAAFKAGGPLLIGMVFATLLACVFLAWIPWLGVLLVPIVGTFCYAGMLRSVRGVAEGRAMRFDDLWSLAGDEDRMVHVAIVALVPLLGSLLRAALPGGLVGWTLGALISVAVLALTYFAVPLVLFRKLEAPLALRRSFEGVLTNLPAVIVFWIACIVLLALAVLPAGLGLLVLVPVLLGAAYEAYAEVYADIELVPNAPPPPPSA
ncbi:MAG: hypothetical protein IT479_05210 [Xanthomonadales bacterium]|nr:hypothetical protein [Xanthomonadales bacterium]MCC6592656.1 hypothetical protein [Xanthomonadales bacterium]MCE7931797.1 hypothetical protein [Xanthomonadales bacterium PRO6]